MIEMMMLQRDSPSRLSFTSTTQPFPVDPPPSLARALKASAHSCCVISKGKFAFQYCFYTCCLRYSDSSSPCYIGRVSDDHIWLFKIHMFGNIIGWAEIFPWIHPTSTAFIFGCSFCSRLYDILCSKTHYDIAWTSRAQQFGRLILLCWE